jgi:hypothetical protein
VRKGHVALANGQAWLLGARTCIFLLGMGGRALLCFAVLAAACHDSDAWSAKGPDGQGGWLEIECRRDVGNCWDRAAEECPHGYLVADRDSVRGYYVQAYGSTVIVAPTYRGKMLVKCRSSLAAEERAERGYLPESVRRTGPPPPASKDMETCGAAFGHIRDLADLWIEWFPGDPLDDLPKRDAFMAVCGDVDDDTQHCLDVPFARAHADCKAQLSALPTRTRLRLNHLFEGSPSQ